MAWQRLGAQGRNPPTPNKMVYGLILTGIGFLAMVAAVYDQAANGKASMIWLVIAYFFHTTGERCIPPVGPSMVTKLAPLRLASLMMGVWFLINFVANWLADHRSLRHWVSSDLRWQRSHLFVFSVVLWLFPHSCALDAWRRKVTH